MKKTNVMRRLDAENITYRTAEYAWDESDLSGTHVAEAVGLLYEQVFKTLVTQGAKGGYYVFVVPVCAELDLKKAAKASGEKSIVMIHVKELLPLTGYIRGGCSPIGMKKPFPTFIDETAELYDEIAVSAGERGVQIILPPSELMRAAPAQAADII